LRNVWRRATDGRVFLPLGEETTRRMGSQALSRTVEEHFQRGVSFKIDGKYDEAEHELKCVLAEEPAHAAAHRELGLVYGFTGLFEESVEELRQAVELDPSDLGARNDLALTYTMLGLMDEARVEFETVLEMDPTNAVALRNIVYFR
jgi:Flp pilus assembly protein TadD